MDKVQKSSNAERYYCYYLPTWGTRWLRRYATNRKVAGSIPDKVIFLNLPNPSGITRPWVYSASN
jgi:hypothetical protein